MTVTDLTAGAWCELQYYYTLTRLPGGRKPPTEQMKQGTRIHKVLEDQVHETVKVDVATREDAMGVRIWNLIQGLQTLAETGLTREVQVWGLLDGHVVSGVIDGLSWEDPGGPDALDEDVGSPGVEAEPIPMPPPELPARKRGRPKKSTDSTTQQRAMASFLGIQQIPPSPQPPLPEKQVYLLDVKTRGSSSIPPPSAILPAKIQLNLYRRFINEMIEGKLDFKKIYRRYGADPDELFSDSFLAQMSSMHEGMFDEGSAQSQSLSQSSQAPASQQQQQPQLSSPTLRYRTLNELTPLVQSCLDAAFPSGPLSVSPRLCVEYRHRNGGHVVKRVIFRANRAQLDEYVANDLAWWKGDRTPRGVSLEDTFKCRSCDFAEDCSWRQELDMDRLRAARERILQRKAAGGAV